MNVQVVSPNSGASYISGNCLGGKKHFTLYECLLPPQAGAGASQSCILKIASAVEHNGLLDREAFILQTMRQEADRVEAAYAATAKKPWAKMNYHFMFPGLVETFISAEQNGRRVLVLDLSCIASQLSELVPLSHLASKEHVRVDPRTSAWIMGKLLKLLVFAHGLGITNGSVSRDNVLINRDEHFVALFDWSRTQINEGGKVPDQQAAQEIAKLAQTITLTLGGDLKTGHLPVDAQLTDDRYSEIIRSLALGKEGDAPKAHSQFYKVVESLWPQEFYPFTTHPLG